MKNFVRAVVIEKHLGGGVFTRGKHQRAEFQPWKGGHASNKKGKGRKEKNMFRARPVRRTEIKIKGSFALRQKDGSKGFFETRKGIVGQGASLPIERRRGATNLCPSEGKGGKKGATVCSNGIGKGNSRLI